MTRGSLVGVTSRRPESWRGRDALLFVLGSLGFDPSREPCRLPLLVSEVSEVSDGGLEVPRPLQQQLHVQPWQHGSPRGSGS